MRLIAAACLRSTATAFPYCQLLSPADFRRLAEVPAEIVWFANIANSKTQWAHRNTFEDFMKFTGIEWLDEFRQITRAYIIAWRDDLKYRELSRTTTRHRPTASLRAARL